tara:strand:+ start:299 stop:823 length:525 start_codon:yes stop_codon:yes gene_type:complete
MKNIFNIVGFQLSWWGCVLGVKNDIAYLGPGLMFVFILIHFYLANYNRSELKLIIIFGLIGTLIDTGMAFAGILKYNGTYTPTTFIAPLWITAMWCGFTATVNHSLSWLKGKYFKSGVLGAVAGPTSYWAGVKFDAISFTSSPIIALITISFFYTVTVPLIYWTNEKILLSDEV